MPSKLSISPVEQALNRSAGNAIVMATITVRKNKINPLRKEPRNLKKGKVLYRLKARKACKYCHGMEGKGNGSMADLMDNAPRNLTCKKYMNKITDGELFWVIKEGIVEGGMPSYKHLSDKKIWQLIQYIRTFSS